MRRRAEYFSFETMREKSTRSSWHSWWPASWRSVLKLPPEPNTSTSKNPTTNPSADATATSTQEKFPHTTFAMQEAHASPLTEKQHDDHHARTTRLKFAGTHIRLHPEDLPHDYEPGEVYRGLDEYIAARRSARRRAHRLRRTSGTRESERNQDSDSDSDSDSSDSDSSNGPQVISRLLSLFGDNSDNSSSDSSTDDDDSDRDSDSSTSSTTSRARSSRARCLQPCGPPTRSRCRRRSLARRPPPRAPGARAGGP